MNQKLSFMNKANKVQGQQLKDALVAIIVEYKESEKLAKKSYWDQETQRGCAIGCCEAALCHILGDTFKNKKHKYLANTLNISEELFYIQDTLYECLTKEKADQFVVDFVVALPVNVDLTAIAFKFKIIVLEFVKKYANQETLIIINNIINLHKDTINGENVDYSASYSAVCSAAYSAYSAVRSADSAVDSALYSVDSAVDSAADSAYSAVCSALYSADSADEYLASELINLLNNYD